MSKLVRDRIPAIMATRGAEPKIEIASKNEAEGREYYLRLVAKLDEEVSEFKESKSVEELADIAEVLDALAIHLSYTPEELRIVQEGKLAARGGFNRGFLLLDAEDVTDVVRGPCCCKDMMELRDKANSGGGCLSCDCCANMIEPENCPHD